MERTSIKLTTLPLSLITYKGYKPNTLEVTMLELMKKTVFAGIGMAAMTKDKIEEVSKECIAQGQLSEKEGEKFVTELMQRSEESRDELKKQVEQAAENLIEKMGLVKADEFQGLRSEIALLREEIASFKTKSAKDE